ncbi:MAG TPA: hypothetical protein VKY35_00020 [Aliidiomarina sp.]|nr:hypothetical protein [Aliidiomarina sp.]
MNTYAREKQNVAILVISQLLFMIGSITVTTLSGVIGQQVSPSRVTPNAQWRLLFASLLF